MYNSEDYAGIEVSAQFIEAMNNEKYASKRVGSNPPIAVGVEVTLQKLDFTKNVNPITPAAFNKLSPRQKTACIKREDGMYDQDNSYFSVQTTGSLGTVSYTSLASYCQHNSKLTTEERKELEDTLSALGKTTEDIVNIIPGAVDFMHKQIGNELGQTLKVAFQRKFPQGWKPEGADENAKGLAFDTRMDVYVRV